MPNHDSTYWAAKSSNECAREIYKRVDAWFQWLRLTGVYNLWVRSVREYYSGVVTGGQLGSAGESDEFITSKENHLHNIGENIVVMTTGSRPSFEPKAKNSDHASSAQVIIAAGLLDNALREKDLEGVGITVTRYAGCLFGEGYSSAIWDPGAGREYAVNPDSGAVERTGDIKLRAHLPIDVARDHTKTDPSEHQWRAIRRWVNRYDLLTQRPELKDAILGLPSRFEEARARPSLTSDWKGVMNTDTDDVAVWEWYHASTDALPGGRMMTLASETCILFDGPLPYDELPVYQMSPEDMAGTQLGYWTLADLLAPQHTVNSLDSTITSAIANVGYGTVWVKSGSNVTAEDVSGQLKIVRSAEKPEPLNLLQIPAEVVEFKQQKIAAMEAISGVNSARRGTLVNDKAMSGAALALVDAKAIEYSKGLERGYVKWLERMATAIIKLYKRYANVKQVALVAGKTNRSYLKEFSGSDLDAIERVTVDLGNPLARTTSGRLSLAQMFLEMQPPIIKTPEQLVQVLTTGRLEPITEGITSRLMNIRAENEALSEGRQVRALATDNHPQHIMEHGVVTDSPDTRADPGLCANALNHVMEHLQLWTTTNPDLLAALGIPPPPVPMGPPPGGPPPGPPGASDGTPPPHPGDTTTTDRVPAPDGMGASLANHMPEMPINPQTGERAPTPLAGV